MREGGDLTEGAVTSEPERTRERSRDESGESEAGSQGEGRVSAHDPRTVDRVSIDLLPSRSEQHKVLLFGSIKEGIL